MARRRTAMLATRSGMVDLTRMCNCLVLLLGLFFSVIVLHLLMFMTFQVSVV